MERSGGANVGAMTGINPLPPILPLTSPTNIKHSIFSKTIFANIKPIGM